MTLNIIWETELYCKFASAKETGKTCSGWRRCLEKSNEEKRSAFQNIKCHSHRQKEILEKFGIGQRDTITEIMQWQKEISARNWRWPKRPDDEYNLKNRIVLSFVVTKEIRSRI